MAGILPPPQTSVKRLTRDSMRNTVLPTPHTFVPDIAPLPFTTKAAIQGNCPRKGSLVQSRGDFALGSNKRPWPFSIYEDTSTEELTNLIYHGTCRLDINTEEMARRVSRAPRAATRRTSGLRTTSARRPPAWHPVLASAAGPIESWPGSRASRSLKRIGAIYSLRFEGKCMIVVLGYEADDQGAPIHIPFATQLNVGTATDDNVVTSTL